MSLSIVIERLIEEDLLFFVGDLDMGKGRAHHQVNSVQPKPEYHGCQCHSGWCISVSGRKSRYWVWKEKFIRILRNIAFVLHRERKEKPENSHLS